ncbi:BamA/TamA family outer membrane protein, partial [bacterium]|nr:BamA/TamA family outer membrane protein [bacterium]
KKIHFNGNRKIKSKKLKKHIITHENTLFDKGVYDEEVLSEDIQALKSFYNSIGYPNSQIGQPLITKNKIEDKIYIDIPIDEGTPVVINEISIINQDLFDSKEILKKTKLKSADVLNLEIAKQDRNSVLLFFSSNGYPYAEVKQDFKYIQDNQVDVIYTVKPGKHVKVGKILIVGNLLTTITTIKKALSLKENDPFAYEEVIKSQLTLRRLGIFNSVEVETIGLDTKEGIVHLLIKVEERRPFQVDIEAGYSTDENFASTLRFTNLNSFGWAKRTGLELTGGKNIAKSELSWIDPHLLGHDIEMVLASWLQYEDKQIYNYSQIGGKVAFLRHLHRTSFLVAQEIDRNYFLTGSSTAADEDSLRDNTLLKTTFSASFDTRNSFAYPTKGIFTQASTDFFNELYGNNARFVKLGSKGEAFYTLFNFFTIVNSARVDRIQNLIDGSSVPSNELLYLGGDNTLRGFGRDSLGPIDANGDPTGGRTRWIYNAELRLPIWNSLKWGFFYDMGSLTEHFGDINLDNVRHSTGFGIRYVTPVGPIRADYGIKLDRKSDEDFGRFHLTFGWAF